MPLPNSLKAGTGLKPGEKLVSSDDRFTFIHQEDGNVVIYGKGLGPIWASGTHGKPTTLLQMQEDGNLVLYSNSTPLWATDTHGSGSTFAVMQLDGNFCLYTPSGKPTWSSQTHKGIKPRNTIKEDGILRPRESLTSENGRFELKHQDDGNVVMYDGSRATWATDTNGKKTTGLVMQLDNNMVLYDSGGPVWASGTWKSGGEEAILQDDGNFVIYTPGGKPVWATNTNV